MSPSHWANPAFMAAILLHSLAMPTQAQDSAATLSLSPAVTTVTASAGATLFPAETLQLTDAVLDQVATELSDQLGNDTMAYLFTFGDNATVVERGVGSCKTYVDESTQIPELLWDVFDLLLGNTLLKVPPIGSPCYTDWNDYDANECEYLSENFLIPSLHNNHPTSIMSPFYQGATCMPIDGAPANCTLGGFPYFAVNASNVAQIQLAVNLARNLNLRLVIKNTGHDFAGKSAGAGALSIWTHHLKDITYYSNYQGPNYSGQAMKIGAGVQGGELYQAANSHNVVAVGGEGQTVGVAGGYIQGGGHSPMGGLYGPAADQVLAYEVVLADGRFVTASPNSYEDLYWALRGGGAGTFGVVTSVTVKVWPEVGVTVSTFNFTTNATVHWQALRAYYDYFIPLAGNGTYAYFRSYAAGGDQYYFGMAPFFAPNKTVEDFYTMLGPWLDRLSELGIDVDPAPVYYDTYYAAWSTAFPLENASGATGRIASRLFPRANWEDENLLDATFNAMRNTTENGFVFLGFNFKQDLHPSNTANSINPAFRNAIVHALTAVSWETGTSSAEVLELSNSMTYGAMDQWRAVSPGSGAYLGEADASEPNWQQSFYGSNYDTLYSIKQKYDPTGVFYARNAVGSEDWNVATSDGLPTQNGRLCRV